MSQRLGLIGFGRFGKALAQLATDAGMPVRAWDPYAEVDSPFRATTLHEAVSGATEIVPAVPVGSLGAVLTAVQPHLGREATVIDVSSVKLGPIRDCRRVLGDRVPWIATHPLFGPSNIALGERPLIVVVCPNPDHPGAAGRAQAFWEHLGCDVVQEDADAHDRVMARTHALAFFVAKAMLDVGAVDQLPFTPPSFRFMARTIDSVREDAAHLFLTIQTDNQFAAQERQRLLDALAVVHRQLLAATSQAAQSEPPPASLELPDLGTQAPDLRETRELIDDLDHDLVRLLARRAQLARRAGRAKHRAGRPVHDADRESQLLSLRRAWAADHGLDGDAVVAVFARILEFSRRLQVLREPSETGP